MATSVKMGLLGRIATSRSGAGYRAPSDLDWLIPVAAIAAFQVALWFVAWRAGLAASPLFRTYGLVGYTLLGIVGIGIFLFRLFRMARQGEPHPLARSMAIIRASAPRTLVIVIAIQLSVLTGATFSALKSAIPAVNPFWLDPYLAAGEERLLGIAPWQLSNRLFGWATPAIDLVYASWLTVQIIAFYALLMVKPSRLKTRALISHSLTWLILGIGGAYLLSSAGPIFYDRLFGGSQFAALAAVLSDAPVAMRTSDMLWRAYSLHTTEVASGISAMPSLHVAMALWLVLILQRTRAAPLAWLYFGLICLGSVHLGWHYVSDGMIGAAGMYAIWWFVDRKVVL